MIAKREAPRCLIRSHRGVTLIEMLIVVVLLAVVASLGAFKLTRRNRHAEVAGLAQELFARAAEARLTALRSGCQVRLLLDPDDSDGDGRVAVLQVASQPGMAPAPFQPPADGVTARREARLLALAARADLGGPPPAGPARGAILFFPDGSVRLNSGTVRTGVTLYLADTQGKSPFRVVIYGRTGFAKVLAQ